MTLWSLASCQNTKFCHDLFPHLAFFLVYFEWKEKKNKSTKNILPQFTSPSHPTLHVLSRKERRKAPGCLLHFHQWEGLELLEPSCSERNHDQTKLQWAESGKIMLSSDQIRPSPNKTIKLTGQFGTHWTRRFKSVLQSSIIEHTSNQKKKKFKKRRKRKETL